MLFSMKLVLAKRFSLIKFIVAIFLFMYETLSSVRSLLFRFTVSKVVPISLLLFPLQQILSYL